MHRLGICGPRCRDRRSPVLQGTHAGYCYRVSPTDHRCETRVITRVCTLIPKTHMGATLPPTNCSVCRIHQIQAPTRPTAPRPTPHQPHSPSQPQRLRVAHGPTCLLTPYSCPRMAGLGSRSSSNLSSLFSFFSSLWLARRATWVLWRSLWKWPRSLMLCQGTWDSALSAGP